MLFMGSALSFAMTYIWSRRNPDVQMSMFGLLEFKAPYMSFVMLAFSFVLGGHLPVGDVLGIAVGHAYWFMDDVYPNMPVGGGVHYLRAPALVKQAFERMQIGVNVRAGGVELPEPL